MSAPQVPGSPTAVPGVPPAATPAAPNASPAPAPAAPADDPNPAWLAPRLSRAEEQARQALLTELGITDPGKAKAAIEAAKRAEEAQKTSDQRLGETSKALETTQAERDRYATVVRDHAARQLGALTTEQQAAVRAIAPDADPAAQLRAVDALRPTWASTAPLATAPTSTPAAAPAMPTPPPTGTAPAPNAPPAAGSVSTPNHRETYAQLREQNPFAAAQFGLSHATEVFPEK